MNWFRVFSCGLFIGACQGLFDASNDGLTRQIVAPNSQALITIVADDSADITWQHMELDSIIARYMNKSLILLADRTLYSVSTHVVNGTVTIRMNIIVDAKTMGNYRCNYNNGTESRTAYFYVGMNTTTTSFAVAVKSYTKCCNTTGVSSGCHPVCDAGKLDFQSFNFSRCASDSDVAGLRKCLMDRKNHVGCCSRRRVQDYCLALCSAKAEALFMANCTEDLGSITQCFYEGKTAIPSPPASLAVQTPDRHSLQLFWSPPSVNFDLATGFLISYKAESEAHWEKVSVNNTVMTQKITGLKMNAKYSVFVQAFSKHGTSNPSEIVVVSMLEDFFYKKATGESVSDCCTRKKVGSKCQALLCAGIPRRPKVIDIIACSKNWHSILECYAGGRNHTSCCLSNGVSSSCLKYCSGKSVNTQPSDFVCLAKANVMTRCFDAGVRNVPSPPTKLTAYLVSYRTINWRWEAPSSRGDVNSEIKYRLAYWNSSAIGSSPNLVEIVVASNVTFFLLSGLKPGVTYRAELSAFNSHGSSLGSNQVWVTTLSESSATLPPQGPHNPAACCHAKHVSQECQDACDLSKPFSRLVGSCKKNAPAIASCIADGRNHAHCCFNSLAISTECQPLCTIQGPSSIPAATLWACMKSEDDFRAIRACFAAGLALLPSAPRALQLLEINAHIVKLRWERPGRGPAPNQYLLQISANKNTTTKTYPEDQLEGSVPIKPNTNYVLHVVAKASGRESLPSNSLSFRTPPQMSADYFKQKRLNFGLGNVTTCCTKQGVTGDCGAICSTHSNASYLWTAAQAQKCSSQLKKIIGCFSDGRDHTGCCKQRQVPEFCLTMCQGDVSQKQSRSLVCTRFLPEIRSCFLDGYETLPAAPLLQEVRELSHSAVRVKFAEHSSNGQFPNLVNYLYYIANNAKPKLWQVKANISSPFILKGLTSLTTYSFFMVAENDNGTSLPSGLLSATTFANAPFSLYILATPSLKAQEGHHNLMLSCTVSPNALSTTFSWYREGERLRVTGPNLTYLDVTRDKAGHHTCQATQAGRTVTRSVFLVVQYKISVTANVWFIRSPLYRSVEVSCTFSGFPDKVSWFGANGKEILASSTQYLVTNFDNNHHKVSTLKITQVLQDSYGEYKCVGKNPLGEVKKSIYIKDPSHSGVIPIPTTLPTAANPKQCCAKRSVSESCQRACSYSANRNFFSNNTSCLSNLAVIVPCLANGRNHSTCCSAAGVPSSCLPLCAGLKPHLDRAALLLCFTAQRNDSILRCMKEGSRILPSEPLSLKVSQRKTALVFSWMPPEKNAASVQSYELKVVDNTLDSSHPRITYPKAKGLEWTWEKPPASHSFNVFVRAIGATGSSRYSAPISTFSLGPPLAPVHLHTEIVGNVSVKLSWETPHLSKVPSSEYKVMWRQLVSKKDEIKDKEEKEERMNVTTKREIVFPCLKEKSRFQFQVVAVNSNGDSPRSKPAFVVTDANFHPHCAKKKVYVTRTKNDMGAYVAVVVLVLFLVAGLMTVLVFIKANRHNPNYAWPGWLLRLPGMRPHGQPVSTFDFDNPVSFDSSAENVQLAVGDRTSYA